MNKKAHLNVELPFYTTICRKMKSGCLERRGKKGGSKFHGAQGEQATCIFMSQGNERNTRKISFIHFEPLCSDVASLRLFRTKLFDVDRVSSLKTSISGTLSIFVSTGDPQPCWLNVRNMFPSTSLK